MSTAAKQMTHAEQVQAVQQATCRQYSVSLQELIGDGKPAHVALARQVAMTIARELLGFGTIELAGHFNREEHGTILWACKRVARRRFNDDKFDAEFTSLKEECRGILVPAFAPKKRRSA
jgi:chromosomal replication initiation ATPase DnaA